MQYRMKRVVTILLMISSMFLLCAATPFQFKAYYEPKNQSGDPYISINILAVDQNGQFTQKVYQAETITHVHDEAHLADAQTAFVVQISGNFTGKVSLHFTTEPLQASYNGMHYIPEHWFSVYSEQGAYVTRIAVFNLNEGPTSGDYPFPKSPSGKSNSPAKSDTLSGYDTKKIRNIAVTSTQQNPVWTLTYPVKLSIASFSEAAGTFDYYSNITLEVDAEKTI